MNFNKVFLGGHITKDIDVSFTPSGMAVAKFAIAVNNYKKDKEQDTSFINVTAFGKQAEALGNMKKGDPLFIEGRLQQDRWQDKQTGKSRSNLGVILITFQFLSRKDKDSNKGFNRNNNNNNEEIPF